MKNLSIILLLLKLTGGSSAIACSLENANFSARNSIFYLIGVNHTKGQGYNIGNMLGDAKSYSYTGSLNLENQSSRTITVDVSPKKQNKYGTKSSWLVKVDSQTCETVLIEKLSTVPSESAQ